MEALALPDVKTIYNDRRQCGIVTMIDNPMEQNRVLKQVACLRSFDFDKADTTEEWRKDDLFSKGW